LPEIREVGGGRWVLGKYFYETFELKGRIIDAVMVAGKISCILCEMKMEQQISE